MYTDQVMTALEAGGHKATFFLNGQNFGNIYDYATTIQRMVADGHQVGSHTWSHVNMSATSAEDLVDQFFLVEYALDSILGDHTLFLRPPYIETGGFAVPVLQQMGYYIINIDIDTLDWQYGPEGEIATSEQLYSDGVNGGGSLSLEHDVHEETADYLVPYIINFLATKNLKSVTVAECLGVDVTYAPSRGLAPNTTAYETFKAGIVAAAIAEIPTNLTPDGTCGGANKYHCNIGDCCSTYGTWILHISVFKYWSDRLLRFNSRLLRNWLSTTLRVNIIFLWHDLN